MCIALMSMANAMADEGMWMLSLLSQERLEAMNKTGLKLTAEDIYDINKGSLKDAVVIFGRGCTGEIVSESGLLMTNHHCGYGSIQQLSSVEHNYLRDGFWSGSHAEDLPVDGLTVRFLEWVSDVSEEVTKGAEADKKLTPKARRAIVEENMRAIERMAQDTCKIVGKECIVKEFFGGEQFFLICYSVYEDVRLVGTPPESIGKFGHDTDNWQWPRHTGDFSIFRVYADKDNKPAKYSADNVPLRPRHSLPISIRGMKEGDYAMTIGYPGSTERYVSNYGVEMTRDCENTSRIEPREIKQNIWLKDMQEEQSVYIAYASKYANSSNYYKNSIGMNKGIADLKVVERKRAEEKAFDQWARQHTEYKGLTKELRKAYKQLRPLEMVGDYWYECLYGGAEIFRFASQMITKSKSAESESDRAEVKRFAEKFFDDYSAKTDQKVVAALCKYYYDKIDKGYHPTFMKEAAKMGFEKWAAYFFANSKMTDRSYVLSKIENGETEALQEDLAAVYAVQIQDVMGKVSTESDEKYKNTKDAERRYLKGRREMNRTKEYYPDANFTMRLSYGTVGGYTAGGRKFNFFTDLEGVMAKEDPNNWEFVVSPRLKELHAKRDYGRYADIDGRMHVCFTTNNDITGGNSGSPVINGRGELMGLAFDGNWEAMSGDIIFEPTLQKCICVDIRYVLFIMDKFAGAKNLINELNIKD